MFGFHFLLIFVQPHLIAFLWLARAIDLSIDQSTLRPGVGGRVNQECQSTRSEEVGHT